MRIISAIKKLSMSALFLSSLFIFNPSYSAISTIDSTNTFIQPTVKKPNAPFVLYTGVLSNTGSASIPKGCPVGFKAYPTFEGGDRELPASTIATQSRYCLKTFTAKTSSVSLSVTTTDNYSTVQILGNEGLFIGVNDGAYIAGYSARAYPSTEISADTASQPKATTNIYFTIYCYPAATAPSVKLC